MPRKSSQLNVRQHLEHIGMTLEAYEKHGTCPLIDVELRKIKLTNKSILRKHDEKRARGDRKDIYVGR